MIKKKLPVIAIAAVDNNWAIGLNNKLLCYLPKDLEMFKKTTLGQIVIMGGNTLRSMQNYASPRHDPLPGRHKIVITRQKNFNPKISEANDVDSALSIAQTITECNPLITKIFVIGGESIYRQFLEKDLVDRVILTHIDHKFEGADAFFPKLPPLTWDVASEHPLEDKKYSLHVVEYIKKID